MKGMLLLLSIFSLYCLITVGSMGPQGVAMRYCEAQGYSAEGMSCVFNAQDRCELFSFYTGECGLEYNQRNPECVEEGELYAGELKPCCEGLRPFLPFGVEGTASCQRFSTVLSTELTNRSFWFFNPILWIVYLVAGIAILLLLSYLIWKKMHR